MPKLIIKRTSELNNKSRDFGLYVNGDKIGVIKNGETKVFDLETGKHQIVAKIDWCQSRKLNLEFQKNETRTIELSGFKYANLIIPLIAAMFLGHFVLKFVFGIDLVILIFAGLVVFLYPIYFITFGRKRYIILNELK